MELNNTELTNEMFTDVNSMPMNDLENVNFNNNNSNRNLSIIPNNEREKLEANLANLLPMNVKPEKMKNNANKNNNNKTAHY